MPPNSSLFERNRRERARTSRSDKAGVSSIRIGAFDSVAAAYVRFVMSWRWSWPRRSADESTRASEHSMRSASWVDDISSENTKHGQPPVVAAFCASDIANDVLPIAGRAASTISSVGCKPAVRMSRSAKPVGTPVMPSGDLKRSSSELNTFLTRDFTGSGPVLSLRCVTSKILASASSR